MDWVSSNGGPLIVVPESALARWSGAGDDDDDEGDTDYDRASDVDDYAGFVDVGETTALVFGDDPAPTTFLADRGIFVRRVAADSRDIAPSVIDAAVNTADWDDAGEWHVDGPAVLFDSAFAGEDVAKAGFARIDLEPGHYAVASAYVKPESDTWLVLVRLTLQ